VKKDNTKGNIMGECKDCTLHAEHNVRIERTEEDVQRLFGEFGEVINLLHKVDKRLEGLYGKIAGIAFAISGGMGLALLMIDKILK